MQDGTTIATLHRLGERLTPVGVISGREVPGQILSAYRLPFATAFTVTQRQDRVVGVAANVLPYSLNFVQDRPNVALQDQENARALRPIPPPIVGLGKRSKRENKKKNKDTETVDNEKEDEEDKTKPAAVT